MLKPESRIKVVYIAGYGRSGTTLMSIALGQHPAILGAGEIHELTRSAWADNTFCSCGNALQECPYWSDVVQRWLSSERTHQLEDYKKLQLRFENFLVMQGARLGPANGPRFDGFARKTEDLFRLITSISGKGVVVDSSKLPGRALALMRMRVFDVYVVHMVRDGRGVAWSLMKGYKRDVKAGLQRELRPKSIVRTSLRWAMVNLAAESLQQIAGPARYVRVRYEDFTENPAAEMNRIGDMIGVDLRNIGAALTDGMAMDPHHQIAGNRLRMNASVRMEKDESWRSQMPASNKRAFGWLCGWLLKRYDYPNPPG